MSWKEMESLARRNQLEAIIVEKHKKRAETGEDLPIPPWDQLPGDPSLKGDGRTYYKIRSLNAARHGLTGQTVVMPWEDRQQYDEFCRQFLEDLKPVGFEQTQLAQTIADCQWRLNRASSYESAIFYYEAFLAYQGFHEEEVEEEMCKARVAEITQKRLLNLTLYESRLQRKMMNARKALKELQNEQREPPRAQSVASASSASPEPQAQNQSPNPNPQPPRAEGPVDFVFSDSAIPRPAAPVPVSRPQPLLRNHPIGPPNAKTRPNNPSNHRQISFSPPLLCPNSASATYCSIGPTIFPSTIGMHSAG
jgi:hypothetical protein